MFSAVTYPANILVPCLQFHETLEGPHLLPGDFLGPGSAMVASGRAQTPNSGGSGLGRPRLTGRVRLSSRMRLATENDGQGALDAA